MNVLCYTQHLTGVGHFVRMHAIASELAAAGHTVQLVDGGRTVPRPARGAGPELLALPTIGRDSDGNLVAADGALATRRALLREAATRLAPDALLVDHFPFSKWELTDEIVATIDAARTANRDVRVLCSLRDIASRTRREMAMAPATYAARVGGLLSGLFDGLLVHADPSFVQLDEHFPDVASLGAHPQYTGYVTPRIVAPAPAARPYAVVSAGGLDSAMFVDAALDALAAARTGMTVHAFAPPGSPAPRRAGVHGHEFSPEFETWLAGASLSISRAGYNTSAALLATRVRAVVAPDTRLSDQAARAALLAGAGLAVQSTSDDAASLHAAVIAALAAPPPAHDLDLDGAGTTRRILEAAPPSYERRQDLKRNSASSGSRTAWSSSASS
jgi:predicted glycosyltransferase